MLRPDSAYDSFQFCLFWKGFFCLDFWRWSQWAATWLSYVNHEKFLSRIAKNSRRKVIKCLSWNKDSSAPASSPSPADIKTPTVTSTARNSQRSTTCRFQKATSSNSTVSAIFVTIPFSHSASSCSHQLSMLSSRAKLTWISRHRKLTKTNKNQESTFNSPKLNRQQENLSWSN